MTTESHYQLDDRSCGWLETAAERRRPAQPLNGRQAVDCAVLGAGFTGLAAARRLAELRPDWRIAVLDGQRAGEGSSGRSSGFVVDLAFFVSVMPEPARSEYIRLARAGIDQLRHQSRACGPETWDDRGWLHVAAGPAGEASLERLGHWLGSREEDFEVLGNAALTALCGSSFYRAGIRLPGSVLVQSGALVRHLAEQLPPTVELYENTLVTRLKRTGKWRLETSSRPGQAGPAPQGQKTPAARVAGEVVADRVLLAVNAYANRLRILRSRVFPLYTFGSLTRRLEARELDHLGSVDSWGFLAQDPMGSSVRRTADGRLLIRNTAAYAPRLRPSRRQLALAVDNHRRALGARYPALARVEFEYTWAGLLGISPNHFPFFGRLDENLLAAAGFTGCGIAMGTALGGLMAEQISGEDSSLLSSALGLPGPRWIPPRPFADPGIGWQVRRMNAQAGAFL